jgi:hypothetical protein
MLRVDRLLENTPERVYYEPNADTVTYFLDVQGKTKRCQAQIEVKKGHSEDEVKSIAATVTEKN